MGSVVGDAGASTGTPRGPLARLYEFFSRSASRHPDRAAVEIPPGVGRDRRVAITYAELDRRSDALAVALAGRVRPDDIVAIVSSRDRVELFVAQLAVSKAGGAFVCIDPSLPNDYAAFIVQDAGASLVLTESSSAAKARELGIDAAHLVDVDAATRDVAPNARPSARVAPENLAYVIYTSGTTGRPKGVQIEHRSIVNLVGSDVEAFGLGPDDRIVQGSSPSYDSSLEETWLAWSVGATLVVLDDATVRSGPDLVEWLRRERVTVFCPPPTLLRATGCRDPRRELPDLKLLYVGGEALTDDVAELWAPGRSLVNGYGPTECTVTATRGPVFAGRPITIGSAVAGNRAWVLDEDLREVRDGDVGELVIGGAGLARGYRNLPDLTAERFPTLPSIGRVYRTGDLVRRDERGEFVYLGRRDTQVKVRGHRIELEAIETRLSEEPGVRSAACTVQGEASRRVVVAFVVATDPAAPPDVERLRDTIAKVLPPPMVPARIAVIAELPTSVGGKLDRKRLPVLDLAARSHTRVAPSDDLERRLAQAFREALRQREDVSVEDDFFLDLGGDSLTGAELVSSLREHPSTSAVTVRDLYAARNVRALAAQLRQRAEANARAGAATSTAAPTRPERPRGGRPLLVTLAQASWIVFELLVAATVLQLAIFQGAPALIERFGAWHALLYGLLIAFATFAVWAPLSILLAATAKAILIGRYRPTRVAAWSGFHLRHWIVVRVARLIPWSSFSGTVMTSVALRALGAKVGARVHVHRGVSVDDGGWDLLELGDDVTLSQDAVVRLVDFEDGALIVGPVRIGSGGTLGIRTGMAPDTSLGRGAVLESLSWLATGTHVPDGELWDGVPAARAGVAPPPPRCAEKPLSLFAHGLLMRATHTAAWAVLEVPRLVALFLVLGAAGYDVDTLGRWFESPWFDTRLMGTIAFALVAAVPFELLASGVIVRLLSPKAPAVVPLRSFAYVRVWIATELSTSAGEWLSGTIFFPWWLRMAGMTVGRNCEISTLVDTMPSLVTVRDQTFMADGIYCAGPSIREGTVRLEPTVVGGDTFVGNHAVIPIGANLPDDVLIGVCTVADDRRIERGSAWFGHPPFELARHPDEQFDRSLTHEPSLARRLTRWFWEGLRFALPIPITALAVAWIVWTRHASAEPTLVGQILGSAVAIAACGLVALTGILALKWGLLGRVKPGVHPLWSCWCSRWDFLYVAWAMIGRGVLAQLEGTLLLTWVLRAFGMRIGSRVLLGAGFAQVVDPDMLEFEDGATVNGDFQAHTFEDRVLKIGRVAIRKDASVGVQSVLFYGADIGAGARVAPHAVVLKGERLAPGRDYAGVPTQPV